MRSQQAGGLAARGRVGRRVAVNEQVGLGQAGVERQQQEVASGMRLRPVPRPVAVQPNPPGSPAVGQPPEDRLGCGGSVVGAGVDDRCDLALIHVERGEAGIEIGVLEDRRAAPEVGHDAEVENLVERPLDDGAGAPDQSSPARRGKDEEAAGLPFVGASGRIFNGMLSQVGIDRDECLVTNVFNLRPKPTNDIKNLCGPKVEGIPGMPWIAKGKYVKREYAKELSRLYDELHRFQPNVIVALGATASWALLHTTGIRKIRGAIAESIHGFKVLPTYHPAAVMREWKTRPIVLADLLKAKRESTFPEIRRPQRYVHIEPSLSDIKEFFHEYIEPSPDLSIDIETKGTTITCIGFAPSIDRALVIPFYDPLQKDGNYWRAFAEEMKAWEWVRRFCGLRKRIVFQNGLYDMAFLWRTMGITVPYAAEDTMLLTHAQQPEMEKSLGFLASVHTDEASWKFMRNSDTNKKED